MIRLFRDSKRLTSLVWTHGVQSVRQACIKEANLSSHCSCSCTKSERQECLLETTWNLPVGKCSELTLHNKKRTTLWLSSTRTVGGSLWICEFFMCLLFFFSFFLFLCSGVSKFGVGNSGSKLFVVRQHSCNISIQFVPRGSHKHPVEHSHCWFLAFGSRAHISERTSALQVLFSLHGAKV